LGIINKFGKRMMFNINEPMTLKVIKRKKLLNISFFFGILIFLMISVVVGGDKYLRDLTVKTDLFVIISMYVTMGMLMCYMLNYRTFLFLKYREIPSRYCEDIIEFIDISSDIKSYVEKTNNQPRKLYMYECIEFEKIVQNEKIKLREKSENENCKKLYNGF
jgi:hypothetical protein